MGLEHLEGKRTGRPRGSKTNPPLDRDVRWAYRNLGTSDAVPPSPLAGALLTLGREYPDRFAACLAALASIDRRERLVTDSDEQGRKADGSAVTDTDAANEPLASEPVRAQRVFIPAVRLMQCLVGQNRVRINNLAFDCVEIVASEFDREQNGVWLTIASGMFPPIPSGTPLPELAAEWLRDPRCRD